MKKLIAKRPILYMGRTYGPGDPLPAHDGRMVEAWERAGTASWSDTGAADRAAEAEEGGLVTGHLDAQELERMGKADLLDLADKLGVDLSGAKNNAERAALIAAVPVQAPAQETGGPQ